MDSLLEKNGFSSGNTWMLADWMSTQQSLILENCIRPHAHLMDFHPAIHERWRNNRLLQDFYPWIKICIWMHTHPLKPMVIREWAHNNPWIWWTDCFKVEDYCVLIHGWPWASMDEYASICRFSPKVSITFLKLRKIYIEI